MKILLQLAREPVMIGAFISMLLFLVGVYLFGNWLYDAVVIPATAHPQAAASVEIARPIVGSELAASPDTDVVPSPVDESPHGLGLYPELPADYPHPYIWRALENAYYEGAADIEHELIHRVLVKLWESGTKVDRGVMGDNGRVYPLYRGTMYVQWSHRADGTRYLREVLCLPELVQYEIAIERGVKPRGVNVIDQADAGIDPYVFLGLQLDSDREASEQSPAVTIEALTH